MNLESTSGPGPSAGLGPALGSPRPASAARRLDARNRSHDPIDTPPCPRLAPRHGRSMSRPVRIANCSGFYGDRFAPPAEMVAGRADRRPDRRLSRRAHDADPVEGAVKRTRGPATPRTFLRQMEQVLGTCLDRGLHVVTNAGGLNPTGLADRLCELADRLGLRPRLRVIRVTTSTGGLGALRAAGEAFEHLDYRHGPGRRRCPYRHRQRLSRRLGHRRGTRRAAPTSWSAPRDGRLAGGRARGVVARAGRRDDWDALAGAVVAGHVIECGPQATGGNYSWIHEVPGRSCTPASRSPRWQPTGHR